MDKREIIHHNDTKFIFHHETLAPIEPAKGGTGKTRFRVEPTIYVTGVGWEALDVTNTGNEFIIGMLHYVRTMETVYGYEHIGNSAKQIKQVLENLWGKPESEWLDATKS